MKNKIIESSAWRDLAALLRYDSFRHVGVKADEKFISIYHYGLLIAGAIYPDSNLHLNSFIGRIKDMVINSVFPIDPEQFEYQISGRSFRSSPRYLEARRIYGNKL